MKKFVAGLAAAAAVTVFPTAAFASGKHGGGGTNNPQAGCTFSATVVDAPMTIAGSGYTPGASYGIVFQWPDGSAVGTSTTADSNGAFSVSMTAYESGNYTGQVQSGGKVISSCAGVVS